MRLLFLGLLLSSCSTTNPWTRIAGQPDSAGLSKFENDETICYLYVSDDDWGQMRCNWKELPVHNAPAPAADITVPVEVTQ